ncbi:MAG: segregation/condensation protein A [Candidatus Hydrogenedentes bacterium]|nr:segregation/condensation protein A [Candidatus Hydrogenedentota bacterium]
MNGTFQENLPPFLSRENLKVKLEQFEGPFEILLYLIREQEINIFDIPIAKITDQYLKILDIMRDSNLQVAGDFLVMAATLIHIKSKMLLPPDIEEEEEVDEEDPRLELVERLLEYRKFKELSEKLGEIELSQQDYFPRRFPAYLEPTFSEEWIEATPVDLVKSIKRVWRFLVEPPLHMIDLEKYTVEEKIEEIMERLKNMKSVSSEELIGECKNVIEKICVILAILELCRLERVKVRQTQPYGGFYLYLNLKEIV